MSVEGETVSVNEDIDLAGKRCHLADVYRTAVLVLRLQIVY
jgi:hypothetical protein